MDNTLEIRWESDYFAYFIAQYIYCVEDMFAATCLVGVHKIHNLHNIGGNDGKSKKHVPGGFFVLFSFST